MGNKLRNKGLWLSVAALVLLVLQAMGFNIVEEEYNKLVNALLTVLTAAGLISDPSTGCWYKDDPEK